MSTCRGPSGRRPLFVNAELVRRGLARTLTIPPNDSYAPLFARLAAAAGAAGPRAMGALRSIVDVA